MIAATTTARRMMRCRFDFLVMPFPTLWVSFMAQRYAPFSGHATFTSLGLR